MPLIKDFLDKSDIFDTTNNSHISNFFDKIKELTKFHGRNCNKYKKFIENFPKQKKINEIKDLPFLPVQIFKSNLLKSINDKNIFKKLTSSGTTSQSKSKIYLDKNNAGNQVKVLNKILSQRFGNKRLPMLIIDRDPSEHNRSQFSASTAAIYGFSIIASKKVYLLDNNFEVNFQKLEEFLKLYSKEKFFIFGFTSSIYQFLYQKIDITDFDLSNGTLIHGGGWKKLASQNISNKIFKELLEEKFKLKNIVNYYGLVEQTGSIFFECEYGYYVSSIFSDVLIRGKNFEVLTSGKKGLIQLISVLPTSYPGHNIITEDIGIMKNSNYRCKCGLKSKHFLVLGRAKEAEIRGCSDAR